MRSLNILFNKRVWYGPKDYEGLKPAYYTDLHHMLLENDQDLEDQRSYENIFDLYEAREIDTQEKDEKIKEVKAKLLEA